MAGRGYELSPKTRGRKGGSGGGEGVWSIESWAQQLIDGAHLSIFLLLSKKGTRLPLSSR